MPKKLNSYALFVKNNYHKVKAKHPNSKPQQIMKLVAQLYRKK